MEGGGTFDMIQIQSLAFLSQRLTSTSRVMQHSPKNNKSVFISLNPVVNAWCMSCMAMSASSSKIAMMSSSV